MGKPQSTGNLVNALAQDSSNNIGIGGAANASFKLQVTGATNLTGALSGTSASFNSNQALTIVGTNSTSANNTITGYSADLYAVAVRQRGASAGISGANFMAQIISATGSEGLEIYTPNSKELILGTNSTARLTIGTTGAATFSSSVTATGGLISNGGAIGYGGGELGFGVTTSSALSAIYTLATGSPTLFFDHRGTSNTGSFAFRNGTGGANTLMTITSGGNVGIFDNTPALRLSVRAADAPTTPTLGTASGHFIIGNGASTISYGLMFGVNNDGNSWIQSQRIDGTATAYNILLQPSGGNVGIGASVSAVYPLVVKVATNRNWAISNSGTGFASFRAGDDGYFNFNRGEIDASPLLINSQSGGNVGIGVALSNVKLCIRGADTGSTNYTLYTDNGTNDLLGIRNDGLFFSGTASKSPYNNTIASVANIFVGSDGTLYRSTASSIKFKENILDWNGNGLDTILALKPKTFKYKKDYYDKADIDFLGLIAEDVAEVCPYLADYQNEDRSGQVENVRYAFIVVPLIKAIQELEARIKQLENK
jgi:hypothetical protein